MKKRAYAIILSLLIAATSTAWAGETTPRLTVRLTDSETGEGVADAAIYVQSPEGRTYGTISDTQGEARIKIARGVYKLYVSHIQYKSHTEEIRVEADARVVVKLHSAVKQLRDVVVSASESRGLSSSSHIGRDAMEHLQPTSLSDLMELLPGGISKDPSLTTANTITLRETGSLDAQGQESRNADYATNSLGTLFLVDGSPINTDANMQYTPESGTNSVEGARDITNRGVDMRSISTDDIESVEIIRGIPSVEYGNLTSGVVNIKKIRKPTRLNARFKADSRSMLFSVGKGFSLDSAQRHVLNVDAGILNAYADPRNRLENYKRATLSARYTMNKTAGRVTLRWSPALEYTGSFDNYKIDPDINYGNIDTYRSDYQRIALTNGLSISAPESRFFRGLHINASVSQQLDRLERTKLISPQRAGIAPGSTEEGEWDAYLIFNEYIAEYTVDGKPFTAFVKASADFRFETGAVRNDVKAGGEWNMSKNFGEGQIYDLSRPLNPSGWGTRPRTYYSIPALHTLSFYAQDNITAHAGNHTIEGRIGLRTTSVPGLSEHYAMHGRIYLDPRVNVQWTLPSISREAAQLSLSAGIGWTTKMPTINYLYPDPTFCDIIQLGYYSQTKPQEYSRYNVVSYRQETTNYAIGPARNRKWEVRADLEIKGNRLWVCFFNEDLSSGFRYSNTYGTYSYKDYDESTIVSSALTGKPDLGAIPYEEKRKLEGYRYAENGSSQKKTGVEFEFTSQRIAPLRTAVKVSGAWFRSTYSNSRPMFYAMSGVYDNIVLSDRYVGLYDWNDGRVNGQFSTNILLDTQIPEWGLIFSTSVQAMWYVSTQRMRQEERPVSYMSYEDGELHPYTDEAVEANPLLAHLIYHVGEAAYARYTIPPAIYVNLKITKRTGKFLDISLFVNKLFDYTPDFMRNGVLIRRNVSPYFGMEMTLKI